LNICQLSSIRLTKHADDLGHDDAGCTRGASPVADPHARIQWREGSDVAGVVSGMPCLFPPDGGITPRHLQRSGLSASPLPAAVSKIFRAQHTGHVIMANT
jgi:hypothetical protein